MTNHFIKVCTITPKLSVGDCNYNLKQIYNCIKESETAGASIAVFPELCLTGYTCGDLFYQSNLLAETEKNIKQLLDATATSEQLILVGAPIAHEGHLFNTACVLFKGKLLGIVPKSFLPNYNEFNEKRWFSAAHEILHSEMVYAGQTVTISSHLLFKAKRIPYFCLGIDICEDLWSPLSPSTCHTIYGATIIANLSASNETVGKMNQRKALVAQHSSKTMCGYLYTSSGIYESTSDLVFSGHQLIYEGGSLLAESELFSRENLITYATLDLEHLYNQRLRFNYATSPLPFKEINYQMIEFDLALKVKEPDKNINPHPFIPKEEKTRTQRCKSIFAIQAHGLARRMEHTHAEHLVIGVSGGLDSTLALLVCVRAIKLLNMPSYSIIGVTMPGFGTSDRTYHNAISLMKLLGITQKEISIVPSTLQHLKDIEHDASIHDTTYENAQARERTQILMDLSNQYNGLVVGTGDLSELALGWATYNGDHMSMYGVNASVPKTLMRYLIEYVAYYESEPLVQEILFDVLATPVSPELLPTSDRGDITQKTEDLVGPYELHDFFIYYMLRFGYAPSKIYHLAQMAFNNQYSNETLLKWLKVFYKRFFAQQFKRSCLPDGPKVGSIGLSPRGDWRMPSDASSALWLAEIESLK